MDKICHFFIGMWIVAQTEMFYVEYQLLPLLALALVIFLGYAKEKWIDTKFDYTDFFVTAAGGIVQCLLLAAKSYFFTDIRW